MYFKVKKIGIHAATGGLYMVVAYWKRQAHHDAGQPPVMVNDFIAPNLRKTKMMPITNEQGLYQTTGGQWVDLSGLTLQQFLALDLAKSDQAVDLKAIAKRAIKTYWQQAKARALAGDPYPADHTLRRVKLSDADPNDLQSEDMMSMVDQGEEVED